jgi:hypothetical protein
MADMKNLFAIAVDATADDSMVEADYDHDALFKLEAKFEVIVRARDVDTNEDGKVDSVELDDGYQKSRVSIDLWRAGNFNLLDQTIDRDDTQKVSNNR